MAEQPGKKGHHKDECGSNHHGISAVLYRAGIIWNAHTECTQRDRDADGGKVIVEANNGGQQDSESDAKTIAEILAV